MGCLDSVKRQCQMSSYSVHGKHDVKEVAVLKSLIPTNLSDTLYWKAGYHRDPCLPSSSFAPQEKGVLRRRYRSQSSCLSPTEGLRPQDVPLLRELSPSLSAWCFSRRHLSGLRPRPSSPSRRMSPIQFPRGLFLRPMPEQLHHHPRRSMTDK